MSRLEFAKERYEKRQRVLVAFEDWMRERSDVPKVLQPVIKDFYDKKLGREQLKRERAEAKRDALVQMFAGFEFDFRQRFSIWLNTTVAIARPDPSGLRTEAGIATALPDSIEACLRLFRSLEPKFHGSEKNWLDKLRAYRNDVIHGGFAELEPVEDPMSAYQNLQRILSYLEVS